MRPRFPPSTAQDGYLEKFTTELRSIVNELKTSVLPAHNATEEARSSLEALLEMYAGTRLSPKEYLAPLLSCGDALSSSGHHQLARDLVYMHVSGALAPSTSGAALEDEQMSLLARAVYGTARANEAAAQALDPRMQSVRTRDDILASLESVRALLQTVLSCPEEQSERLCVGVPEPGQASPRACRLNGSPFDDGRRFHPGRGSVPHVIHPPCDSPQIPSGLQWHCADRAPVRTAHGTRLRRPGASIS